MTFSLVVGEGKGKERSNPSKVEMDANVQALSQDVARLELKSTETMAPGKSVAGQRDLFLQKQ